MRRHGILLCVIALTTALLSAQDYRVEVRLVELEVRVTDRQGRADRRSHARRLRAERGRRPPRRRDRAVRAAGRTDEAAVGTARRPAGRRARDDHAAGHAHLDLHRHRSRTHRGADGRGGRCVRSCSRACRPGFKVSLGGRAFTDDRATLLTTLSHLSRNPLGSNGQPGLVDLARPLADDAADERALAATFRRQEEGMAPLAGFTVRPERIESRRQLRAADDHGRVAPSGSLPVYGDVALNQYFDLVEKLAALPGKKAIVLMRPGLAARDRQRRLAARPRQLCRAQARELLHRRFARPRVAAARRRKVRAAS